MKCRVPVLLSSDERKRLKEELLKQVAHYNGEYQQEADAIMLWTLHVYAGWGKKKLLEFWNTAFKERDRLKERYEMGADELEWLYKHKLKEQVGVDIEELYAEK